MPSTQVDSLSTLLQPNTTVAVMSPKPERNDATHFMALPPSPPFLPSSHFLSAAAATALLPLGHSFNFLLLTANFFSVHGCADKQTEMTRRVKGNRQNGMRSIFKFGTKTCVCSIVHLLAENRSFKIPYRISKDGSILLIRFLEKCALDWSPSHRSKVSLLFPLAAVPDGIEEGSEKPW